MGKTTKALFIWHEKYVSTFCLCTQLVYSSLGIIYNLDNLLSPHALWYWVYILPLSFHSFVDPYIASTIPLVKTTLLFSSLTT